MGSPALARTLDVSPGAPADPPSSFGQQQWRHRLLFPSPFFLFSSSFSSGRSLGSRYHYSLVRTTSRRSSALCGSVLLLPPSLSSFYIPLPTRCSSGRSFRSRELPVLPVGKERKIGDAQKKLIVNKLRAKQSYLPTLNKLAFANRILFSR